MHQVTIAKSFLSSTMALSAAERSGVLDFLMKFQSDPSSPGLNLEGVKSALDSNIKSARITQAVRAIIHQSGDLFTLLYSGQRDDAYDWASRRTLKKNPTTGVLQIVENSEELKESFASKWEVEPSPPLFAQWDDSYILSLGLPEEWLPTIRLIKTEDQIPSALEKLPEQVGESLLSLAAGEFVTPPKPVSPNRSWESCPENLRRFRILKDSPKLDYAKKGDSPHAPEQHLFHKPQRGSWQIDPCSGIDRVFGLRQERESSVDRRRSPVQCDFHVGGP